MNENVEYLPNNEVNIIEIRDINQWISMKK
jgi:hypothetical protein